MVARSLPPTGKPLPPHSIYSATPFFTTALLQTRSGLAAQIALTRHAGLNTIRLEGKMESDMFYGLMDSLGMLAMPGW